MWFLAYHAIPEIAVSAKKSSVFLSFMAFLTRYSGYNTIYNTFIHPQLGTDNKIVFKDNVPVFHNVRIPYVHQLQNVLHEHNENISIYMQIFKI